MTPEYIYNEMTWNEANDAMEYVFMYDLNAQHFAIGQHRKNKKITDWWKRKKSSDDALREFGERCKKKTGG
jgi:hypothetical protein